MNICFKEKKVCMKKMVVEYRLQNFNTFPDPPFWDCPKFKEAADNNWNVAIKG